MKFALKDPMTVFARAKGMNGAVRELKAVMDFNWPYCVISSKDGMALGYLEAALRARDWEKTHPDKVPYVQNFRGIERSILVNLPEVHLGNLVARDVGAIMLDMDLPLRVPIEMILGRSFLDNFKFTVDGRRGYISLSTQRSRRVKP